MSIPFEFTIDGPPVSQQARDRARLREWQEQVHEAASTMWQSRSVISGDVAVAINYFCFDSTPRLKHSLDVDNVPKPILDALKGLIYEDDKQVIDIICRRRNRYSALTIHNPSDPVRRHMGDTDPFLHVSITFANAGELNI